MNIRVLFAAATAFAAVSMISSSLVQAGVVISVGSATLTAGGSSQLVNVYGSWIAGPSEGDSFPVDKFGFSFKILPSGSNSSIVSFKTFDGIDTRGTTVTDDDIAIKHNGNHEQTLSDYVFYGDSYNRNNSLHTGFVSGANNDEYKGGDKSASGLPFVLTGAKTLLFQLELFATGDVTTPEIFSLAVTSESAGMSFLESPPLPYTVNGGEITVVAAGGGPTPVPEPSTALIFATGLAALCYRRKQSVSNHQAGTSSED